MDDLVSIIIPIYNVEVYLHRCLDSVLNQTYQNLEVILVNDGSTDKSALIAQKYVDMDKRFFLIHKPNGGLSDARNTGLDVATGRYITFIDSDDYVGEQYVEKLLALIHTYHADISIIQHRNVYGLKTEKYNGKDSTIQIYNNIHAIENMWYQKDITNSAWGKLYAIDLFRSIRYPVQYLYEDLGTTYKLFYQAEKIVWSSEVLYYYYQRSNSIMNAEFCRKKMDRIALSEELLEWTEQNCKELRSAAIARFFTSNIQVLREIPNNELYRTEVKQIENNIKRYRNEVIRNRKVKCINRLIAVLSVLNIHILQWLGTIYKKVYK